MSDNNYNRDFFENKFIGYNSVTGNGWGINWRASQRNRMDCAFEVLKPSLEHDRKSILEIGCASADFTKLMYPLIYKNDKYVGADLSVNALEICKKMFAKSENINFAHEELPNTSFSDNEFDIVVCMDVFHYFPADIKQKSANEIKRILKPSGVALLMLPILNSNEETEIIRIINSTFSVIKIKYIRNMFFQKYIEPKLLYVYEKLEKEKKLGNFCVPFGMMAKSLLRSQIFMRFFYILNQNFWQEGKTHIIFLVSKA